MAFANGQTADWPQNAFTAILIIFAVQVESSVHHGKCFGGNFSLKKSLL